MYISSSSWEAFTHEGNKNDGFVKAQNSYLYISTWIKICMLSQSMLHFPLFYLAVPSAPPVDKACRPPPDSYSTDPYLEVSSLQHEIHGAPSCCCRWLRSELGKFKCDVSRRLESRKLLLRRILVRINSCVPGLLEPRSTRLQSRFSFSGKTPMCVYDVVVPPVDY